MILVFWLTQRPSPLQIFRDDHFVLLHPWRNHCHVQATAIAGVAEILCFDHQAISVMLRKSSGMQLPFNSLQLLHAHTRFTIALVPPRQSGIQWSTVSPSSPQYQHLYPSRSRIWFLTSEGIFQRLCDRIWRTSGGFHFAALPQMTQHSKEVCF